MATWVEDIVQALKNLGGQAHRKDIFEEVRRIRKEPLPFYAIESMQERIEAHTSDSAHFQRKADLFMRIGEGVWALRDFNNIEGISERLVSKSVSPLTALLDNEKEINTSNMDSDSLITDNGLFVGKEMLKFSVEDSLESISNLFQTIKQYRDYADKENVADWFEYIHAIFSILGLNTIKISPRLFKLQDMGVDHEPKALVCIVGPNENYDSIAYEVTWESYLFYAAKFHNLEWVILTNGLQFKVMNCTNDQDKHKFFQLEFDEVVEKGNINSFFTFYKILNVINQYPKKSQTSAAIKSNPLKENSNGVLSDLNSLRNEFWTEFLERAKTTTDLFANRKPNTSNIMGLSSGKVGVRYNPTVNANDTRVEIYIDNGNYDWNKSFFDYLYQHKSEIETSLGKDLEWMRFEEYRGSVIRLPLEGKTMKDKEAWPEIQDSLIDNVIKIVAVFQPLIKDYPG